MITPITGSPGTSPHSLLSSDKPPPCNLSSAATVCFNQHHHDSSWMEVAWSSQEKVSWLLTSRFSEKQLLMVLDTEKKQRCSNIYFICYVPAKSPEIWPPHPHPPHRGMSHTTSSSSTTSMNLHFGHRLKLPTPTSLDVSSRADWCCCISTTSSFITHVNICIKSASYLNGHSIFSLVLFPASVLHFYEMRCAITSFQIPLPWLRLLKSNLCCRNCNCFSMKMQKVRFRFSRLWGNPNFYSASENWLHLRQIPPSESSSVQVTFDLGYHLTPPFQHYGNQ